MILCYITITGKGWYVDTHTHTHTYIYIYVCISSMHIYRPTDGEKDLDRPCHMNADVFHFRSRYIFVYLCHIPREIQYIDLNVCDMFKMYLVFSNLWSSRHVIIIHGTPGEKRTHYLVVLPWDRTFWPHEARLGIYATWSQLHQGVIVSVLKCVP